VGLEDRGETVVNVANVDCDVSPPGQRHTVVCSPQAPLGGCARGSRGRASGGAKAGEVERKTGRVNAVFILAEGAPGVVSSTGWREDQNHTPLAQSAGDELYVLGQDGG
jgi:hypothetical protein